MGVILLNSNNNNHEQQRSLDEINNTINFNHNDSASQKFLAFLGPGLLVAVGYMDPGNWITSMQGGAQYGYTLLFIILIYAVTKYDCEIRNSNWYGFSTNDTSFFK